MPITSFHRALALVLASVVAVPVAAQVGSPSLPVDTLALEALRWRLIGPFRSGRSVAVAGSERRPLEYYAGTTGGGVMKTTNGGYSWEPVTDKYFGGTIGGIAVYQPNPDVVYVGTGEWTLRGNVSPGDGVYKTTDGGQTWESLGLRDTRQISRVIVHPWNPAIVWVAALGHATGPNPERGIFRSTDGGKTWVKTLFVSDSVGATDLQMDPADPDVLYAATWRVVRKPWDIVSGGPGSGIYKSTDGGEHWTEITRHPGLPGGVIGNVGLAVSPANHRLVWAMIESDSGGLFRSADAGATWTRVNDTNNKTTDGMGIHWRPFYFSKVFADPVDTNTVYLPNGVLYRSTDGGRRFSEVRPYDDLWDTHTLWIAPHDPDRMIVGADQGARITVNRGANWSTTGYATGQFYHIIATSHFPYRVCGAQQDNVAACGPSRTDGMFDISAWYYPGGGESGMIAVDPADPEVTWAPSEKVDHRRGYSWYIPPAWERTAPPDRARYRWNWTTPIVASAHARNTLYQGANVLFKSTDGGIDWRPISPDLTRHDPATLVIAGGPITKETSGAENYATIFAIAESPVAKGLIWVGSDDGLVHVTRDDGARWRNVTPAELPPFTRISMIEASPHAAGTAYVAANRNKLDDYTPYLYKTADFGATWTRITTGIPSDEFVRVVREDPIRRGLLFAGTERGVWFSLDAGGHWQSLRRNLPPVPVRDLVVKEGDLAIATHGRSLWILDDISPLRQLGASTLEAPAHLFQPTHAYRVFWRGQHLIENLQAGEDPPSGASIYYWLTDSSQVVTIDIRDARGALVNHFSSAQDSIARADSLANELKKAARNDSLRKAGITDSATLAAPYRPPPTDEPRNTLGSPPRLPAKPGLNRFGWSFRYADGVALRDSLFRLTRVSGPVVVPGTYTVELRSGGVTERAQLTVLADPRVPAGGSDFAARLAQSRRVNAAATELIEAANQAFDLRTQIDRRLAADSASAAGPALRALRDTLLAFGHRMLPRYYHRNESAEPYTSTILAELRSFGFGEMNRAPNAAERAGADTMIGVARSEVARLRATVRALVESANDRLRASGQPLLAYETTARRAP